MYLILLSIIYLFCEKWKIFILRLPVPELDFERLTFNAGASDGGNR